MGPSFAPLLTFKDRQNVLHLTWGWEAQGLKWRPVSPGFTEIMPWQSVPLEESLPTCQKGDTFLVGEVKMLEKQTSPPDYLTEAELITLMEKHGIGGCAHLPAQARA